MDNKANSIVKDKSMEYPWVMDRDRSEITTIGAASNWLISLTWRME
jgi:hypothetical protein